MIAIEISISMVEEQVRRCWRAVMEKSAEDMIHSYTYDSIVFHPHQERPESGRVCATRREREYCTRQVQFHVEITSPIQVQLLSPEIAVANYRYRMKATGLRNPVTGKSYDKEIRSGRATQVFVMQKDGELQIASEHLSETAAIPSAN